MIPRHIRSLRWRRTLEGGVIIFGFVGICCGLLTINSSSRGRNANIQISPERFIADVRAAYWLGCVRSSDNGPSDCDAAADQFVGRQVAQQ